MTTTEPPPVAWRVSPCRSCGRPTSQRCRTATDEPCPAHQPRLDHFAGWLARQLEVDALNAEADRLVDRLDVAEAAREDAIQDAAGWARLLTQEKTAHVETRTVAARMVADLRAEIERLAAILKAANENGAALAKLSKSQAADLELAAQFQVRLRAEFDAYKASHPDPTPKPTTLFGAGGGNIDRTKTGIDIDRWYGGPNDIDKAVAKAKANHAAGILTWVSFKCPFSWADMATGKGDAWAAALFGKLEALGFEVWVAFHHEPEGDGDTKLWTAMQARLSHLVPGGIGGRVKFWVIVTGWHQEFGTNPAYKWEALYPKGAPIYGIAYDAPYLAYGKPTDATKPFDSGWTEGKIYVEMLAARAKSYGVKAAIGEFGYSDEAFAKDKAWLDRTLASVKANGLLGAAYFDSTLNSSKSWTLGPVGSPKRAYFYAALAAARQ